jgi:hypothetical protein
MPRSLRTAEAPREPEQPSERSASEGSSGSGGEPRRVFQKATVSRQKSHGPLQRKTSMYRQHRPVVKTAETPARRESSPPPPEWQADWRKAISGIKKSDWCRSALQMIENDRRPNPSTVATLPVMEAAYRYGLTAEDAEGAASIFLYTSALFSEINGPLRKDKLHKLEPERRQALGTIIANMDSGLPKLPEVKEPLIRVVRLDKKAGRKLQVGEEWSEPAFGSCFRASKPNMKWDGNYELHIHEPSDAHDVSALSDASNEGEVLVVRGKRYRIIKRTIDGQDSKEHVPYRKEQQDRRVVLHLIEIPTEIDPKQKST